MKIRDMTLFAIKAKHVCCSILWNANPARANLTRPLTLLGHPKNKLEVFRHDALPPNPTSQTRRLQGPPVIKFGEHWGQHRARHSFWWMWACQKQLCPLRHFLHCFSRGSFTETPRQKVFLDIQEEAPTISF